MIEHGERIARVDSGACQNRLGRIVMEQSRMRGVGGGSQFRDVILDEPSVHAVGIEFGMPQKILQEPNIGEHTFDSEFTQRAICLVHSVDEICRRRVHD